ncbi:MAG: DNA gyrase subunit A [Thermodesulfobacteriota bacterium]
MEQANIPINIEDEMKTSYMQYAMSVIVGRALPDVRDGLKPVHRRTLFAMYELKNHWDRPYKKSARVVGDVIGKYHPHGEAAVYDSLVRMAQDFSLRYPLVDGQGNFGSIDGDSPAAMRYTEVRMSKLTAELLADIDKETIEFTPNYDESLREPLLLPAKFPNLLVNGSSGIAVGMATNIPPHSLSETIEAVIAVIRNPQIGIAELLKIIPGPDFPTGALILGQQGIRSAYETGKGIMRIRARVIIEKPKKTDRHYLVITELPYQVNKSRLIERIAELVREKVIEGIHSLRDESDREGMRVVIELKKNEVPQVILNQLFNHTQMEISFGIIMLAVVNNQPRLLNIKDMLSLFIEHRRNIVTRRCRFELNKAESRAHILEGLKLALERLDSVIAIIKRSKTPQDARDGLMKKLSLSGEQAQAILDMRLQRLTALERGKILEEYKEVIKTIARLREILAHDNLILNIIVEELTAIRDTFSDDRRTEIIQEISQIDIEDMIAEENMVVTITHRGYIKRNALSLYQSQHRGGRGKIGMITREEDFVENLFIATTHSYILFFTNYGKVHWLKVHEIPQGARASRGKAIVNLLNLAREEKITAILPLRDFSSGKYIAFATKRGIVKKTNLSAFSKPRSGGILAILLDENDELISAKLTEGNQEFLLGTKSGAAIRISEKGIRPMGRITRGVRGIAVNGGEVVGMEIVEEGTTVLTVTENGFGKRTKTSAYRIQNRGGKGVITIKTTKRNGNVIAIKQVADDDELVLITTHGKIIRLRAADISVMGRNTQGVKLIGMAAGESVVGTAISSSKELI